MHKRIAVFGLAFLALGGVSARAIEVYMGADLGGRGGMGGAMTFEIRNLAVEHPLGIALSGGYYRKTNPGDATKARKIFINDNEGGMIEKHGDSLSFAFDLSYVIFQDSGMVVDLAAGPRFASFSANFTYHNDNEDFDVRTQTFGAGVTGGPAFVLGERFLFLIRGGLDYYLPAAFEGHGKYYYTPDGIDDNPRADYTYEDADEAVYEPEAVIFLIIGIRYQL